MSAIRAVTVFSIDDGGPVLRQENEGRDGQRHKEGRDREREGDGEEGRE